MILLDLMNKDKGIFDANNFSNGLVLGRYFE